MRTTLAELIDVPAGLAGVAVTTTAVGDVLGELGLYHYRGRDAAALARHATFEAVAALVLDGSDEPIEADRRLPDQLASLIPHLDLRTGLSALAARIETRPLIDIEPAERRANAVRLIAAMPTLIASIHHGRAIEPNPALSHVGDYLRMLGGKPAPPELVAGLESYFVLTIDHGFNSSTFTARVVASTGADLGACVVAGFGALSGPRHGANQARMLDMFDAIGEPEAAEGWMKAEIAARRRLQGFGHSVYRRTDPRIEVLSEIGAALAPERHRVAVAAEEAGTRLLAGRRLVPNVDLHAAIVLEACGIPTELFGATFAAARMVGWCAHALEQATESKIIRPGAHYVGPIPEITTDG